MIASLLVVLTSPSATLVILFPPASMPSFLILGVFARAFPFASTKLKPLLLITVPPAFTLSTFKSFANAKSMTVLPSSVLAATVIFFSSSATPISTLSPALTA